LGAAADVKWLSPLPLWAGILAGPVAWALDLSLSYALVKWTCASRQPMLMHALPAAALAMVATGAVLSFIALRRTSGDTPTDGGHPVARARFMAILGLTVCALFALTIVAGTIPWWVLDACR
jgi:dolichyl-phosphate-mannose--protein O-mannosyl transferase